MTAEPVVPSAAGEMPAGLRRGAVNVLEAAFQSFSYVAPAGDVAILLVGTVIYAGGATPLAVLIAWLIYGLWMVTPVEFSRVITNAGSYYAYSARGIKGGGALALWYWMGENLTGPAFAVLGLSSFIYVLFATLAGTGWAWAPMSIAILLSGAVLSYRGVRPSTKFTLFAGSFEAIFLIVTAIIIIAGAGPKNTAAPFTLSTIHGSFHLLFLAVIFSLLDFTGLGTATTLSEEVESSKRKMRKALWLGWLVAGAAVIIPAYALTVGWGASRMATYGTSPDPGLIVYRHYLGNAGWGILIAVTITSYLSYMVAKVNAVTRIWFSGGRDGIYFRRVQGVHKRFRTPYQAVLAFFAAVLVINVVAGALLGPATGALWLLTISGVCIIAVHIVANTSLTAYMAREGRRFRILLHGIIPSFATVVGGIVIYYSVYPLPKGPTGIAVIVSLVWLALGFGAMAWYIRRHPEALRLGGRSRDEEEEAPATASPGAGQG
ncbi:MAG TPA: APC family permease [Streptosporangiaceae bacterium]|nr:APC family permease [Streptosporangiaceae bacterium]